MFLRASVLLSFFLTRYIRNLANARGWLAAPALDRHLHQVPLPRIGGVAIYSAFVFTVGVARLISWRFPSLDFWFFPQGASEHFAPSDGLHCKFGIRPYPTKIVINSKEKN